MEQRSLCFEHLRDPDSRETRDLARLVPERKYSCQTDSGSCSPELPASVGNVPEITVAGLMGVNTVADGERPRPAQQKGVQYRGKILAASRHTELFCGAQSPLQSRESTSRDNIVV